MRPNTAHTLPCSFAHTPFINSLLLAHPINTNTPYPLFIHLILGIPGEEARSLRGGPGVFRTDGEEGEGEEVGEGEGRKTAAATWMYSDGESKTKVGWELHIVLVLNLIYPNPNYSIPNLS